MDFETLAQIWRNQDAANLVRDEADLVQRLRDEHQREDRRLLWLNVQEGVPSVLLFVIFLAVGLRVDNGGWAWIVAAILCLGVGLFLAAATLRQRALQADYSDSVNHMLRRSLEQVKQRQWLYRNIFWWYLLPISLGLAAIVYEFMLRDGVSPGEIAYILIVGVLYFGIYLMNRRIATQRYQPTRERLEAMLRHVEGHVENSQDVEGASPSESSR